MAALGWKLCRERLLQCKCEQSECGVFVVTIQLFLLSLHCKLVLGPVALSLLSQYSWIGISKQDSPLSIMSMVVHDCGAVLVR